MTIALITGANRGLGKNTALELAKNGVDIIFTYRTNKEEAHQCISEIEAYGQKAIALALDVGEMSTFSSFTKELKRVLKESFEDQSIDYLLNNAGHGHYCSFTEMKESDFDQLYNVHLKGVYFLTQRLVPLLKDGGKIINISSGLTRFSYPGSSAYAAMKGAIEVFTRYLAIELGPRKITVNTIAPGAVATDFGGGRVRDNKDINSHIAQMTALKRTASADDIGPVIANFFLHNDWVNAQRIEASGGIHI